MGRGGGLFSPSVEGLDEMALTALGFILPRLDWLALSDRIVYKLPIPEELVLIALFYTLAYCGALFLLASAIFDRREF